MTSLDKLADDFRTATRDLLTKREGDAHFGASTLVSRYAEAKRACLEAGMPESVLDEIRGEVLAERGGVGK